MLPGSLAPIDSKTRALTTIYAPRKQTQRKNKTAQSRMLENNLPIKATLSPFSPLPAIGQKLEREKTKLILFDINHNETKPDFQFDKHVKLSDVVKPLTPLKLHGFIKKQSLDVIDMKRPPHPLLRENTYDVIEPIYLHAHKVRNRDSPDTKEDIDSTGDPETPKISPKSRFKKAAMEVRKLNSLPETGKLLCLREKQTFNICINEDMSCKLEDLPQSPAHKLNKISEIFQNLDMNGRHRDRMKKENSWF